MFDRIDAMYRYAQAQDRIALDNGRQPQISVSYPSLFDIGRRAIRSRASRR
jgi:hypothetical protein